MPVNRMCKSKICKY